MSSIIAYILCFSWLPFLLTGLLGLILGYLLWGRGEGPVFDDSALKAEGEKLRTRIRDLEGQVSNRDTNIADLKTKLTAANKKPAAAPAAAVPVATKADDDETYALEWRNRYLAARVKYLEGRLAEAPKKPAAKTAAPKKAAPKKAAAPKKPAPKKPAPKKAPAKKAAKPKVLYTDGPTDGKPDDLKRIKGIGPKFEKDLNNKGIYYFRQIANWTGKDVKMVEGIIDSIPGRIQRDEWVKQAKGFAAGIVPKESIMKSEAGKSEGNTKYYKNVKKFDSNADTKVIDNIVKYCGVSLRSRDASLVACSDQAELDRVAAGFCVKKLGITKAQGADLVKGICQDMKSERFKNRVTFYYLAAKKAGKLSVFK